MIARLSLQFNQPAVNRDGDSECLPNGEVVVVVVDDGWNATVWINLQVFLVLLFFLAEIEVDRFICQPKFLEDDCDLPVIRIYLMIHQICEKRS